MTQVKTFVHPCCKTCLVCGKTYPHCAWSFMLRMDMYMGVVKDWPMLGTLIHLCVIRLVSSLVRPIPSVHGVSCSAWTCTWEWLMTGQTLGRLSIFVLSNFVFDTVDTHIDGSGLCVNQQKMILTP